VVSSKACAFYIQLQCGAVAVMVEVAVAFLRGKKVGNPGMWFEWGWGKAVRSGSPLKAHAFVKSVRSNASLVKAQESMHLYKKLVLLRILIKTKPS
jgi:hypothetical protein